VPGSLDFEALAKSSVVVFYMGLKHLPAIAERLIAAGRSADTPAAAIADATTPRQRVCVATLGTIAEAVARDGIKPPAIVVVGETVALRDRMAPDALTGSAV